MQPSNLQLVLNPVAHRFYIQEFKPREHEAYSQIVDLQPLGEAHVAQLLLEQSEVYLKQHLDEIEKMIELLEGSFVPGNFIETMLAQTNPDVGKSKANADLFRPQLRRKFQAESIFRKIDPSVISHICHFTSGNPLFVCSYFYALLTTGCLQVVGDTVTMTELLRSSLEFESLKGHFQIPYEIQNHHVVFTDRKIEKILQTTCSPLAVIACIHTLRVSAVIGFTFQTSMLTGSGLCPSEFRLGPDLLSLHKTLDLLEEHDFIELVDEQGLERQYRFNFHFLADTIS